MIAPEVGGGFGSKLNVYAEEALLGFVAMKLGKPVKWIESRRENCAATIHGRGHVDHLEIAAKKDGTIIGLKLQIIQDLGAYHQLLTACDSDPFGSDDAGPLQVPQCSRRHHRRVHQLRSDRRISRGRAARSHSRDRAHGGYARCRAEDGSGRNAAEELPEADEFPFATATGLIYDSGDYAAPLRQALATVGYEELRKEQEKARAAGKLMGIGISTYGEICAFGPSPATPAGGWESATVKMEPSGTVTVLTGSSPHGQGEETTFAQIAADELGVPLDDVTVLHGDTSVVQYGIGTFGSREHGRRRWRALVRTPGNQDEDEEVRRHAAGIRGR